MAILAFRCTKCDRLRVAEKFYKNAANKKTGYDNLCVDCRRKWNVSPNQRAARKRYNARQRGEAVPLKRRGRKAQHGR